MDTNAEYYIDAGTRTDSNSHTNFENDNEFDTDKNMATALLTATK